MVSDGYLLFVGLACGIFFSVVVALLIFLLKRAGTLRVDRSDDQPYLFLELTDKKKIKDGGYVILRVKNENYIPQE